MLLTLTSSHHKNCLVRVYKLTIPLLVSRSLSLLRLGGVVRLALLRRTMLLHLLKLQRWRARVVGEYRLFGWWLLILPPHTPIQTLV